MIKKYIISEGYESIYFSNDCSVDDKYLNTYSTFINNLTGITDLMPVLNCQPIPVIQTTDDSSPISKTNIDTNTINNQSGQQNSILSSLDGPNKDFYNVTPLEPTN